MRWDVEGVSPRLWGGSLPAPGAWRGPGLRWWRNERLRPARVRDPNASLVRLFEVEPPDPCVDEVVRNLHPGGDECLELPHGYVAGCGARQEDQGEEPVWVDHLEVSLEGCHQPARGCVGVDVVDWPQFLFVKEVRVPLLWWSGGWGGHGLPVLVRCGASWGGVPWGGVRVSLRYAPCGGLLLRGHGTGRGGGWGANGLLRAGGLCHFFVRSRVACVAPLLLWCVLGLSVVRPRHSQGGEPRGALARLVGWRVPVSGAGAVTPRLRGRALMGSSPDPLFGLLVCCGSPWPRVRGVPSPQQRTGR